MIVTMISTDPPQPSGLDEVFSKIVLWPQNEIALFLLGVLMMAFPPSDPPAPDVPALTATIVANLQDGQGNPVPGIVDLPFYWIGSPSTGDYVSVISASFDPPIAGDYTLLIDGTDGQDVLHLEIPVEVEARES